MPNSNFISLKFLLFRMVTEQQVIEALQQVKDPELGVDIWTLGLVYKTTLTKNQAHILMTLTTPLCPYGPMLLADVKTKVGALKGIKKVDVEVTFNPPWKPKEEVRELLGV